VKSSVASVNSVFPTSWSVVRGPREGYTEVGSWLCFDREKGTGEIRVRLRLTNAADDALARRGQLAADQVHWLETDALIGTGPVRSVIPQSLLAPPGSRPEAGGPRNTRTAGPNRSA